MSTAHGDEPSATSPCESNDFSYLLCSVGLYVELWTGEEGLSPGMMDMRSCCPEGHGGVDFADLLLDLRIHHPYI